MTAYIINCLFDSIQIKNTFDCGLGAICNSDVYIVNSTFGNNILYNADIGGAVSLMEKANVYVYNSVFFTIIIPGNLRKGTMKTPPHPTRNLQLPGGGW